jgi:radical SAM/Cys-rich protein
MKQFRDKVVEIKRELLTAVELGSLQVNVGYQCTMACTHCHVSAGPARSEMMDQEMAGEVLRVLSETPIPVLDITGGAPELNPSLRGLITGARKLGKQVKVRTNLTVFFEDTMADLPGFYAEHGVELVASLPSYREDIVDRVRGRGTFNKSIASLRKLNTLGYGVGPGGKTLHLVYNPPDAVLAPEQDALEKEFRRELGDRFNVFFNHLYVFTNMPIGRFHTLLVQRGDLERYQNMLVNAFNPLTLDNIMCRRMISVGWDGRLYDCDFNQALGIGVTAGPDHIRTFDHYALARRRIVMGDHCFGCTAGAGST